MATLTKEQYAQLKGQGRKNYIPQTTGQQTVITADKFIGELQGNASTASALDHAITLSLGGDASGSVQINANNARLDATIHDSEHANNADTAENAKHSAQASHADLANIATIALQTLGLLGVTISVDGTVIKQADAELVNNGRQIHISIDEIDSIINTFVVGAWNVEDNHATNKIYVDTNANACYVYINNRWTNLFAVTQNHLASLDNTVSSLQSQITTEKGRVDTLYLTTSSLQVQINANKGNIETLQNTTANHESRIGIAENNISSLTTRVGNIETATDVGEIAVRVQAVENKNSEQDNRLDAINSAMVTLSTAQYIAGLKRFNQAKVEMSDNPDANDAVNFEFVNNKSLSISQYVEGKTLSISQYVENKSLSISQYVENKTLSISRYVDDVAHTLSSAMYHLDSDYVTLSTSQYVSGEKDFASIKTGKTPSVNSDVTNKQYVDTAIENKPSKYIGEQVISYLPLEDAKVHLLDGNVLTATNYNDFVAYIERLYTSNPNLSCFTTESTWQANVTANGVCSKFVVDTTNHTVRLPKMGSQILTQGSAQSISANTLSANIGLSTSVTLSGKTGNNSDFSVQYPTHTHTLSGAKTGTATLNQSVLNSIAKNLSVSSSHFEDVYYYIVVKLN